MLEELKQEISVRDKVTSDIIIEKLTAFLKERGGKYEFSKNSLYCTLWEYRGGDTLMVNSLYLSEDGEIMVNYFNLTYGDKEYDDCFSDLGNENKMVIVESI